MNSDNSPPKNNWQTLVFFAGILFVCILGISRQSLWIDEASTALVAQQTTLPNWWQEMRHAGGGSNPQMPLYMIWVWICEKFVGSSEITLRAINIIWILPGLIALWKALARRPPFQLAVFLVAVFNPFLWYYLVEARPYAMQIGASLFLAATLYRWSDENISSTANELIWVWGFVLSLIALSGASLLGMVWAGGAIMALWLSPGRRRLKLGHDYFLIWFVAAGCLAALGFYYLWTLHAGARASDVASTGWKNIAFTGYELLGFAGLGPGRLEIRDDGLHVFKPYAPELGLFALLILALVLCATLDIWRNYPRKKILQLVAVVAAPAIFILMAGFALHFRVLGRHLAPLLAAVVFLLGLAVSVAWRRSVAGRILVMFFFVFYLASGLLLRFAPRHAKDDYRSAAGLARNALAGGKTVWWSADPNAAAYYQLPLTSSFAGSGRAYLMINPDGDLTTNAPADMVIISHLDIYDTFGDLAPFLARNNFKKTAVLPAFVIWEKSGVSPH